MNDLVHSMCGMNVARSTADQSGCARNAVMTYANNTNVNAQAFTGYWRVGGDNLGGWPGQPSSFYFAGSVDEVAVYGSELSASSSSMPAAISVRSMSEDRD